MGLSTCKHAPQGKILKSDVTVAKNYLGEAHVKELNRIVSAYLDLAENRAERGIVMKMSDRVLHGHAPAAEHRDLALAVVGPERKSQMVMPTTSSRPG
jgi:Virulence protein RhuM family